MRVMLFIGMVLLNVVGQVISLSIEGNYLGEETTSALYSAMNPPFITATNPLTAVGGFFISAWDWIQVIWEFLSWDFAFFTDEFILFRLGMIAFSVGVTVSLVLAIRGTSST